VPRISKNQKLPPSAIGKRVWVVWDNCSSAEVNGSGGSTRPVDEMAHFFARRILHSLERGVDSAHFKLNLFPAQQWEDLKVASLKDPFIGSGNNRLRVFPRTEVRLTL
jgi:hypothetical protein